MTKFEKNWKCILEMMNSGKTDEEIAEKIVGNGLASIRKIRRNKEYYQNRVAEAEDAENHTFEKEWKRAVNRIRTYYGKPPLGGAA